MHIDKPAVAVKAVLIAPDNTVLMLREAATNPDGTNVGKLHMPGGRLNWGETVDEALMREVREETGIDMGEWPRELLAHAEWRPVIRNEQWQIIALFFFIRVAEKPPVTLSLEHDGVEWIPLSGAIRRADIMADELRVLESAQKKLRLP